MRVDALRRGLRHRPWALLNRVANAPHGTFDFVGKSIPGALFADIAQLVETVTALQHRDQPDDARRVPAGSLPR